MNRALFFNAELSSGRLHLPSDDRRAQHMRSVLRVKPGDTIQVGVVNGRRGEAVVEAVDPGGVTLLVSRLDIPADALYPVTLLLGHPRPIVLKRILKDAVTAGYGRIHVVRGETTERSYMESRLWDCEADLQNLLIQGAEQAGGSKLPELKRFWSLSRWLDEQGLQPGECGLVLDPASDGVSHQISDCCQYEHDRGFVAAVGSERGWSSSEIAQLKAAGFSAVRLGNRVLRTETAVQWAIAGLVSLVTP